mgnify:FL=1
MHTERDIIPPTPIAIPANMLNSDPADVVARYRSDCAATGKSPYGANRHERRARASQRRRAHKRAKR